jgi:hypothetical protein
MVETYNKTYRYILLLLAVAISALVIVATLFRAAILLVKHALTAIKTSSSR